MKKLTHEEFVSSLYEANQNLTVLGQYINSSSHIDMKCDICGYEWSPVANDIRRLHGCPRCSGQVVKSTDYFIQMLSKSNKNVEIISEYNGYKKKSLFRCKIHDIEFEKTGAAILRGVSCEECTRERSSKSRMKTTEQFKQDLFRINKNIFITSEYSGSTKKIDCKCLICGHIWSAEANALLKGEGCPVCSMSHGERKISNYLSDNGIPFETQKKYSGLVGINNGELSFDFYLPTYNLLIEYQGEFHSGKVNRRYQSVRDYEKQIEHDSRKKKYAIDNGIELLEIWHWDFNNIEDILNKYLLSTFIN